MSLLGLCRDCLENDPCLDVRGHNLDLRCMVQRGGMP